MKHKAIIHPLKNTDPDLLPLYPILELAGDHRVLIENHLGVVQYSDESIGVKMKYGKLFLEGKHLSMDQMTKVKLIISGIIDKIYIEREEGI